MTICNLDFAPRYVHDLYHKTVNTRCNDEDDFSQTIYCSQDYSKCRFHVWLYCISDVLVIYKLT